MCKYLPQNNSVLGVQGAKYVLKYVMCTRYLIANQDNAQKY